MGEIPKKNIVKVEIELPEDYLKSVEIYAGFIGMDKNKLLRKMLISDIKSLRAKINALPFTSAHAIMEKKQQVIQEAPQTGQDIPPVGC